MTKKFWLKKFFGVQKFLRSRNFLGKQNFLGKKIIWGHKNFGIKNFGEQKKLGPKMINILWEVNFKISYNSVA